MATIVQTRRHEEAKVRDSARAQRDAAQQLAQLDIRLGVGVGAARERARLQRIIADELA